MTERLVRERTRHGVARHALGATLPTPRVIVNDAALEYRPVGLDQLADGFEAELIETAERGEVRGRERRVVQVEVFRQMGSVRTSILEDLDVYPRTSRRPSTTPSTAKSRFTDAQAVDAYRAFSSFLLGQLLLESAVRGAETGPVEEPLDEGAADIPERDGSISLQDTPEVLRLRALLSEDRSDEEFEVSLEVLLDRLAAELTQ